ncbi:MAG: sigma-70 family RNA polymerase sigma factor [Polyangiaceae bacterium]|nr:sigma-70 family RNA polymerase sigma factor [Polyangiaceae bacterium]
MIRYGWSQALDVGYAATNDETDEPRPVDFRSVFDSTFDYVWLTLRRLGVRERDLEDVAHDVFLIVHRNFETYDPSRPIRPWLLAFAVRAAADYRRLARHRVELRDDTSSIVDPGPTPHEQAVTRERLDLVALALDALDFDRRTIFVLHEIDGVPMNEAAAILGIGVNTAYSRLRLAKADFARAVQRLQLRRGDAR